MNIINEIIDFFVRLVRGRFDSVEIAAKSKMMTTEAKLKANAARRFNSAIDGAVDKGRSVAGDKAKSPTVKGSPSNTRGGHG